MKDVCVFCPLQHVPRSSPTLLQTPSPRNERLQHPDLGHTAQDRNTGSPCEIRSPPQGRVLWHVLPGLATPSKSLLPSQATKLQVADVHPLFRSTGYEESIQRFWYSAARGLKNTQFGWARLKKTQKKVSSPRVNSSGTSEWQLPYSGGTPSHFSTTLNSAYAHILSSSITSTFQPKASNPYGSGVLDSCTFQPGRTAMEREDEPGQDSKRKSCVCMQIASWGFDSLFPQTWFSL